MKTKHALPNLNINFDPLALLQTDIPAAKEPALTPGQLEAAPVSAPAEAPKVAKQSKQKRQSAGNGLRQRGLWLSDEIMLQLRIEALRQGTTASRLADSILRTAIRKAS